MHSILRTASRGAFLTLFVLLACMASPLAADSDWAEVQIGEVTIQHVPDLGFNVTVNRFDGQESDDVAENVYVFQTDEPPAIGEPIRLDAAKLVFKEDHLVVVSLEEPWALGFYLSDTDPDKVEQLAHGLLKDYYDVARPEMIHLASGYGLARHAGRFALPLDRWPPANKRLAQKSTSGNVTAQASCTTGGPGASAASITCINGISEGSVSCRTGYYACCKCTWYGQAQCSCEADSSGGGGGCAYTPPCDPYDEN